MYRCSQVISCSTLIFLAFFFSANAAPFFTIAPANSTTLFASQILSTTSEQFAYATYVITNNSGNSSSFYFMNNQPLISQLSTGNENDCTNLSNMLPARGSCNLYLKLTVPPNLSGTTIIKGGPQICRSAHYPIVCNSATGTTEINTTISDSLLTFSIYNYESDPYYQNIIVTNNTGTAQTFDASTTHFYNNQALSNALPVVNLEFCGQAGNTCDDSHKSDNCQSMPLANGASCTLAFHVIDDGVGAVKSASALTLNLSTGNNTYAHIFSLAYEPNHPTLYVGGRIYHVFGSYAEIYKAIEPQKRWSSLSMPSNPNAYEIKALLYDANTETLYAGGNNQDSNTGAFTGVLWAYQHDVWQDGTTYEYSTTVNALGFIGSDLYVAGNYYDHAVPKGFTNKIIAALGDVGTSYEINAIAELNGQVYVSGSISNSGQLIQQFWKKNGVAWNTSSTINQFNVYCATANANTMYVGGGNGATGRVYYSTSPDANSWQVLGYLPNAYEIRGLAFYGSALYAVGTSRDSSYHLHAHLWRYDNKPMWTDLGGDMWDAQAFGPSSLASGVTPYLSIADSSSTAPD